MTARRVRTTPSAATLPLAGGCGRGQFLDAGLLQAQVHLVRGQFEVACGLVVEVDDHRARGHPGLFRAIHHEVRCRGCGC